MMLSRKAFLICVLSGLIGGWSVACTEAQCLRQSDCPPSHTCRVGICKSRTPLPDGGVIYIYEDSGVADNELRPSAQQNVAGQASTAAGGASAGTGGAAGMSVTVATSAGGGPAQVGAAGTTGN